jgi:site-specific recombinase XerD
MQKINIILRKDQKNAKKEHYIYISIKFGGLLRRTSLNITVKPENWDNINCMVLESDPEHSRKNKYLKKEIQRANAIIDKFYFEDKILSADEFMRLFKSKGYADGNFADFIFEQIDKRAFAKETKRTYLSQITKIKQFKNNIYFSDLSYTFVRDYETYMVNQLKNNPNTVSKSLSMLRTFINWAVDYELIKESPFKKIKVKKRNGNREYLSLSELSDFQELYKRGELKASQHNVLRYFLFSCYTGLRYTDIKNLKFGMLHKLKSNEAEQLIIRLEQHKTKSIVSIPIIDKAQQLIGKFYGKSDPVFKVLSNQKTNDRLKDITAAAGIDKNITFHSARHTFATVAIEKGIPMEVISTLLGHTELKTTQIYAKINDQVKIDWMKRL